MKEFTVLHLFSGIGGAALGFQQAVSEYKGMVGRFRTLAGIDVDPEACQDFRTLTGAPAVEMDLFSRADYIAFHGHEPPADWREVSAEDLLAATGGEYPDVVFLSPPCKGFTGLLPEKVAMSEKYQALNRLVVRGLALTMQAFGEDPPSIIMLENVPRITSRGEWLLRQVKRLLRRYGYVFHEGFHCCGEIGGLAQRRKRYLLIARLEKKMTAFVYRPPSRRLKTIGEVLGKLPLPDDPSMGPMHRLPRLQWRTWVRLALIPPGGDWRDLEHLDFENLRLKHTPRTGAYQVAMWDEPCGTVIGSARVQGSNGVAAIADPRVPETWRTIAFRVVRWEEPGPCITGARFGSGALAVADPRLGCRPRSGSYKVQAWNEPAATVIGAGDIHAGAAAVADPRIPTDDERPNPPPVIIALDGTWHRPLTTLELAVLQGFPAVMPDGRPLTLVGKSDARWRERIGNAVPPPTARAIGEQILLALLVSSQGEWALGNTGVWVVGNNTERMSLFSNEGARS
ncbi:DNA cytosine methyltransferase [Desulfofundulus salinus]|uniref:DNA (cytosine-5-)-methyltransferase n=1 Tax=Desulfofundulus salinus TaxID=2419843 RepID=A0A494X2L1_9FIRM|nr:DNA cytosine methyltransferase [Desulfofundulus salinum]RKO67150.1 DNA cytosine methyltransferase [Desulfofundulus salinum]